MVSSASMPARTAASDASSIGQATGSAVEPSTAAAVPAASASRSGSSAGSVMPTTLAVGTRPALRSGDGSTAMTFGRVASPEPEKSKLAATPADKGRTWNAEEDRPGDRHGAAGMGDHAGAH